MQRIFIPFKKAKSHIKEADILLFRPAVWYEHILAITQMGEYSHVGLASWHNGNNLLEIIQFSGSDGGGNTKNLGRVVQQLPHLIDVYRVSDCRQGIFFNPATQAIETKKVVLPRKQITNMLRSFTGLPYGWKGIWWFLKKWMVGLRLFYSMQDVVNDTTQEVVAPVCSTIIAHIFSHHDFDLIKNRADKYISPGVLALSTHLHYLFTLE